MIASNRQEHIIISFDGSVHLVHRNLEFFIQKILGHSKLLK